EDRQDRAQSDSRADRGGVGRDLRGGSGPRPRLRGRLRRRNGHERGDERSRRLRRDSRHGRGPRAPAQRARTAARHRAARHQAPARGAGGGARNVTDRWVIATGNRGKLAELEALLAAADLGPLELIAQTDLGVPPAEETAITFLENALAKARHAARHTGLAA